MFKGFGAALFGLTLILGAGSGFAADHAWPLDQTLGRTDAPVTIVEYSSLTCPHCARFHAEVMPKIKADWIEKGKAKLIIRDFAGDPLAQAGAMIAHCSGDRYFTFIDVFYHAQANWLHAAQPFEALKSVARLGGMGPDQIGQCLDNHAMLNEINARRDDGIKLYGITGTPSFVINGKMVTNIADYETFAKVLTDASR